MALTPHSVAAIVKAPAELAGLDAADFSGPQSAQRLLTTAAEHGAC